MLPSFAALMLSYSGDDVNPFLVDARKNLRVESACFFYRLRNPRVAVWLKRIGDPSCTVIPYRAKPREHRQLTDFTGISHLLFLVFLLTLLQPNCSTAQQSIFGMSFDEFVRDNMKFSGFTENTTGLAISHGSHFFDTSNRFDMNRFTIQPEFNIKFCDDLTSFISWRFIKEPRYSMESKSRKQSVQPAGNGTPLPSTYYDEYSPVPWEAVFDYKPNDQLTVRWGRQFISWGEADGVRLLDLINPQNSTFSPPIAPNLFNLDETRIPSWGLRTLYTVKPETNTTFEFFALPGALETPKQRVDEFVGTNDTTDRTVKYGRWSAHPETRIPFGRLFTNPLGANAAVVPIIDRKLPSSASSWKFGTRIIHNFGNLNTGLGYIWGYNPQASAMLFKLAGTPSLCGPPTCPPGGTQLPLKLVNDRTSIYAAHFNYPIADVMTLPINTTLRGEMAFFPTLANWSKSIPCAIFLASIELRSFPFCIRTIPGARSILLFSFIKLLFSTTRTVSGCSAAQRVSIVLRQHSRSEPVPAISATLSCRIFLPSMILRVTTPLILPSPTLRPGMRECA
jgi:hypothetical protein